MIICVAIFSGNFTLVIVHDVIIFTCDEVIGVDRSDIRVCSGRANSFEAIQQEQVLERYNFYLKAFLF